MIKPRKVLEKISAYQTDEYPENYELKLDANENPFGPSPKVLEAFSKLRKENFSIYPYYGSLIDEISKKIALNRNSILLTNGCDEAISVIINTYIEKDDEVLSFSPTFSMPKTYTNIYSGKFVDIPYQDKWHFDIKRYTKQVNKKTKIIYLTSPNSPTGDSINRCDVEFLCREYPEKLILLDVTYSNYMREKEDYFSLINDFSNLFIVKSFSKDYALAGLRLGYIVTNPFNITNLKKVISPYSVNSLAVLAGLESLKDEKYFQEIKKEVKLSKDILYSGLKTLGYSPYPSDGNFIFCDFGEKSEFVYKKLLINSVKVRRYSSPKYIENCFRITIPSVIDSKRILDILKPRKMIIFDMDGVIFDVRNSYRLAIEETVEYYTKSRPDNEIIQSAKNMGGLNCDWDLTEYLIQNAGYKIPKDQIIKTFQNYFFNPQKEEKGFIDNEKLLIDKMILNKLSQKYDLAIFTGRPKDEAIYSLQRFGIQKYFTLIIAREDLPPDRQKPYSDGLELIQNKTDSIDYCYLGDSGDDMICAVNAGIKAYGVMPPGEENSKYEQYLKQRGANKVLKNAGEIINYIKR